MKIGYHFISDPEQYCLSENSSSGVDKIRDILKKFSLAGCEDVVLYYSSRVVRSARQGEHMANHLLQKLRSGDTVVIDTCFFDLGFKQSYFPHFARSLRKKGIHLVTLNGQINTKSKRGDVYLEQLCWYIEQKNETNRHTTREGVAKAAQLGRKAGRKRGLSNSQLPEAFSLLKKEKIPVSQVAKMFNISSRTLYRYLKEHSL